VARIRIKNSSVSGKVPLAGDLQTAELALNVTDRKLYSKDTGGNVFELGGGEGANVPGGDTPPPNGNTLGDLFFDTTLNQLLYWDGTQWVPIAGDEVQNLGDLNDVTILNPDEGELLYWNGTGWVNADPGYLTEGEINNILEGLNPDGSTNPDGKDYLQTGDNVSELDNDAGYLTEEEVNNILEGLDPDGTPDPDANHYLQTGDNVSELENDAGYLTADDLVDPDGADFVDLPYVPLGSWADIPLLP
jgi:hypothetical protein